MASRSYGACVLCQTAAVVRILGRVSVFGRDVFSMEVRQMDRTDMVVLFVAKHN